MTEPVASIWLTLEEAAAYARMSKYRVRLAVRNGELRAGGTQRRTLFRQEWLDEWLSRRAGDAA